MPATLQSALFVVLCLALAAVLMALGAVWLRLRALPLAETARLMEDLAKRQRELETLLARLDAARTATAAAPEPATGAPSADSSARPVRRLDRAVPSAVAGPTLIAVPNMAAKPGATSASAELGRKFGAIWALADEGASAAPQERIPWSVFGRYAP